MTPESPLPRLDLLVVGGLTVDRFADGSAAAGGSVLHAARAARDAGRRVGVVTACGDEPEVAAARDELAALPFAALEPAPQSISFRHAEGDAGRELVLLAPGAPITTAPRVEARAVLHAPVAGEIGPVLLGWRPRGAVATAILQGWLRRLSTGERVTPLPVAAIAPPVVAALRSCALLVASREDLAGDGGAPDGQLDALRAAVGPHPALVLTDGIGGAWLDLAGARWHEPVPRVVAGSTVGAGDMLAALLAVDWPRPAEPAAVRRLLAAAMRAVADRLAPRS